MTNFKKHPDGYMSFLGRDDKGLYSVRIGWQVYASNANGSVLYKVKDGVKTPLNVFRFQTSYPKTHPRNRFSAQKAARYKTA